MRNALIHKWPPSVIFVDDSPDAYEFDMADPHQGMRDALDAIQERMDEGEGDTLDEATGQGADSEGAGLLASIADVGEYAWIRIYEKVVKAADAGDMAGALAIIDGEREAGRLDMKQALQLRGDAYERVGDVEGQLKITEEVDGMDGKIGHEYRAELLYRLGRYGELADLCDAWRDSYSGKTELYLNRARLMYARGNAAGAQRHAEAILKLEGYAPDAHELIGDILADGGDLRGAVMRYNRALEQDYNVIHYHVKKAGALVRMGRPDAAALACRRGLNVRPQNKMLKKILAESH